MTASHRRGPWSNHEDQYLMQLVHQHGPLNWVRISQTLGSRTPKQCRERYHQNLKPSLNHDPITPEEGQQIERMVHELGKRWAEIARRLHGRSDNAVKNWWNGSQNRRKRMDRRRAVHSYDDHYSRSALTIQSPALPIPRMNFPQPNLDQRHPVHNWVEAPLPSPSCSESAESESGSNYTTSPGRHMLGLRPPHAPVALPPLRLRESQDGSKLPSLRAVKLPSFGDRHYDHPQLPPLNTQTQLPTAPNSPTQQQALARQQPQDARMNVATLLD